MISDHWLDFNDVLKCTKYFVGVNIWYQQRSQYFYIISGLVSSRK